MKTPFRKTLNRAVFLLRKLFEPVLLLAVILFLSTLLYTNAYLLRIHYIRKMVVYTILGVCTCIFGVSALLNLFLTFFRGPGDINKLLKKHQKDFDCLNDNYAPELFFECEKCECLRLFRCHHCSLCGKCQPSFDHHCPVIACCVGFNNRRNFFLFLLHCFIGGFCSFANHWPAFFSLLQNKYVLRSLFPRILFMAGPLSAAGSLAMIVLFVSHLRFALRNSTTYDNMVLKHMRKEHPTVKDPFCNGTRKENWNKFHARDQVKIAIPVIWWMFFPL
ncbi:hypothetical protein GEMRC1_007474 [Eukaryota sp. GEM-RC1]